MGRRVLRPSKIYKFEAAAAKGEEDTYKDRLLKYIPTEIVGLYITLSTIALSAGGEIPVLSILWVIFALLFIVTPLFYFWVTKKPSVRMGVIQIIISTIAFAVWVFSLGELGPFGFYSWYHPVYAALLLPTFTALVAGYKGDPR